MNQPPLSPPAWLFPVAWTILYILMGIACFLVWIHSVNRQVTAKEKTFFFVIYSVQLVFNFCWSIFFFNWGWHWFAFVRLIALWAMVLALVVWGFKNQRAVAWVLMHAMEDYFVDLWWLALRAKFRILSEMSKLQTSFMLQI